MKNDSDICTVKGGATMITLEAMDVANIFISRHGSELYLTNLKLNKLVYYAQVESLRETGSPLFADTIEAWGYGPVEPNVYHNFKLFGDRQIKNPLGAYTDDPYANRIVDIVTEKYGFLTAFDLVNYSHRNGGAWKSVYDGTRNKPIDVDVILNSRDVKDYPQMAGTLAQSVNDVNNQFANALRLLGDA